MKILLTGASGNLGQDIVRVFGVAGHDVLQTDRDTLDITDVDAIAKRIDDEKPDFVINTAAYNFVDKVEAPDIYPIAYAINALGPKNLAEACAVRGIPFVHYSTDYVFQGDKEEGYTEEDVPNPISKYGATKAAGERFVIDAGGKYFLCRLSKIFGQPGISEGTKPSFVALMLKLAKEKPSLQIVDEEVGMPSYTRDIAEATLSLLVTPTPYNLPPTTYPSGIYHIVNEGIGVTWYAFAEEIFHIAGVTTPRTPVSSSAFPRAASAPKFAMLRNTKLPKLRPRIDALREFLKVTSNE